VERLGPLGRARRDRCRCPAHRIPILVSHICPLSLHASILTLPRCYNNRRRRRMGAQPMYGTGWIPGSKPPQYGQHNQNYYPNQPYNGGAPAPPYSAPPVGNQNTGTTFNPNDGYYGGHNNIEMQPPQSTYQPQRGGDPVYEAPMGPPPGKGDGIIR